MTYLKNTVFVLICIGFGVWLGRTLLHFRHPASEAAITSTVGIGNAPPLHGFSLPAEATPETLNAFPPLHVTAVAVPYTADLPALTHFVQAAHALHFQVMLLPPPLPSVENPYPKPLPQVAAEAQAASVDVLCLSWLNTDPDPDYWRAQIPPLRKSFKGQLLIAATPDILPGLEFLDLTDYLGAIGPFDLPLPKKHGLDLHTYEAAWASVLDSFESLSLRYGKRGILIDFRGVSPGNARSARPNGTDSADEALRCEALVTQTKGRDALEGIFLPWSPTATAKPADDPLAVNHDPALISRIAALWHPSNSEAKAPSISDAEDAGNAP